MKRQLVMPQGLDLRLAALTATAGGAALAVLVGLLLVREGPLPAAAPLLLATAVLAGAVVARRPHAGALALLIVLASFPIARLGLSAPVYATDVLLALTLAAVGWRAVRADPVGRLVVVYVALWIPAWAYQVASLGLVAEPTYGLLRNALAVGAFFVGLAALSSRRSRDALVGTLAAGALVTSVLAVLQILPATAASIQSLFLHVVPDFAEAAYRVYPERAFGFFTAPTTLSGFFAVVSLLLLSSLAWARGRLRLLVACALVGMVPGLIATYSRGWVPAFAVGLLVLLALNPRMLGRGLVIGLVLAAVGTATLAGGVADSGYLGERFGALGARDPNVQTRVERAREFVAVSVEQPLATVVGHGFAGQDLIARDLVDTTQAEGLRTGVSETSFLLEIFDHGLPAGVMLLVLMGIVLRRGARAARVPGPDRAFVTGLVAALACAAVLHAEQYFTQAVFMRGLFWLLMGVTVGASARVLAEARAEGR